MRRGEGGPPPSKKYPEYIEEDRDNQDSTCEPSYFFSILLPKSESNPMADTHILV